MAGQSEQTLCDDIDSESISEVREYPIEKRREFVDLQSQILFHEFGQDSAWLEDQYLLFGRSGRKWNVLTIFIDDVMAWDVNVKLLTLKRKLGLVDRYKVFMLYVDDESFSFGDVQTYDKVFYKGELFKIGNDVVVKVDALDTLSEERGHWKACITSFFSMQLDGKAMMFFGATYYKQCITGDNYSEELVIDTMTGMSILQKTPLPFTWDSVRPIYYLLHKFIPLPLPRSQRLIAYEVKDLKQRAKLLMEGNCGNVPLWLEHDDIVKVRLENNGTIQFKHAVVRCVQCDSKITKLAILKSDASDPHIWKVHEEENTWRDWDSCVLLIKDWIVLKRKKVRNLGESDRWIPILWRCP
ncbi:hypothetical protein GOP47_0002467 [Adiantum capillus-veneris]|uniref:Uncharacterized protein n=1 Tax=Adiantum capillus-veneris TaxID=13818 RepID=A0A9D4VAF0_ADICA|nr:hypothetical protein GOP47_0002467 [Adiantum capillus-veneris]